MDYSYKLDKNFSGLGKEYKIFTHLWRPLSKEMLLVDDHMPLTPTTQWKAGETIRYSRTFFIPQFLDEFDIDFVGYEDIELSVGFYNPDPASTEKKIILFEKKIQIQPASVNAPDIVYNEGWEELETNNTITDPFQRKWRWTNLSGNCTIDNPKKTSTLILKCGVPKAYIPDQKVTIRINEQIIEEFIPDINFIEREYTITPEMMGTGEEFLLKVEADKTFVPSKVITDSRDNRELGIQVFFLYFREKPE